MSPHTPRRPGRGCEGIQKGPGSDFKFKVTGKIDSEARQARVRGRERERPKVLGAHGHMGPHTMLALSTECL